MLHLGPGMNPRNLRMYLYPHRLLQPLDQLALLLAQMLL